MATSFVQSQVGVAASGQSREAEHSENHYVIVVHGTFDASDETNSAWHRLDESDPDNFCRKLNDKLEELGIGRPVCRSADSSHLHFKWSGENRHSQRMIAGAALFELITAIMDEDVNARVHIIAHSHGCNVALVALNIYLDSLALMARLVVRKIRQSDKRFRDPEYSIDPARVRHLAPKFAALRLAQTNEHHTWMARLAKWMGQHLEEESPIPPQFATDWVNASEINRIGKIVFLGAPLLKKVWRPKPWWSVSSAFGHAIDAVVAIPVGALSAYISILSWWLVVVWPLAAASNFLLGTSFMVVLLPNPADWPGWLQAVLLVHSIVLASSVFRTLGGWQRKDRNVYFDSTLHPKQANQYGRRTALPYHLLNINAGMMDEVLLGFSVEPLVFGAISPQIREMLLPSKAFQVDRLPIGLTPAPRNSASRLGVAAVQYCLGGVARLMSPFVAIWEKRLVDRVLVLLSGPALGLAPREFADARIVPSSRVDIPEFFQEVEWNVSEVLANMPVSPNAEHVASSVRYRFLWDASERDRLAEKSSLWPMLKQRLAEIRARNAEAGVETEALESRILITCLMLEERLREIFGTVQLAHSAYYSNSVIIDGIATFLVSPGKFTGAGQGGDQTAECD